MLSLLIVAATPSHSEAAEGEAAKPPPWSLSHGVLVDMRAGGHLATQSDHFSGVGMEFDTGYQFGIGLAPILSVCTAIVLAPEIEGADVSYAKFDLGLRWTFDTGRVRPWVQVSSGLRFYSAEDSSGEAMDMDLGPGVSGTVGVEVGLAQVDDISFWLSCAGGLDVSFLENDRDLPARVTIGLALHR